MVDGQMRTSEVRDWYLHHLTGSDDQRVQMLAQMNDCTVPDIRLILDSYGVAPVRDARKRFKALLGMHEKTEPMDPGERGGGHRAVNVKNEDIRTLHAQGLSDYEIGYRLGTTAATIFARRQKLGLMPNRMASHATYALNAVDDERAMKAYKEGLNDREVGEIFGVSPATMHKWRRMHGVPPTNPNRCTNRSTGNG